MCIKNFNELAKNHNFPRDSVNSIFNTKIADWRMSKVKKKKWGELKKLKKKIKIIMSIDIK